MKGNDIIRENILNYLYQKADKSRGPNGAKISFSELCSELKQSHTYKSTDVTINLLYLIDRNWIVEERDLLQTSQGISKDVRPTYRISADGIDHIEGPSKFLNVKLLQQVNIQNVTGVVSIGDDNIVNASFTAGYEKIEELQRIILSSAKFDDAQKINLTADLNTIRNQISKPSPDKSIVKKAWETIKVIVTASEFIVLMTQINPNLGNLIS